MNAHDATRVASTAVGGFFLAMAGIHVGIVAADTEVYRHFADGAFFDVVHVLWRDVFMAQPQVWGLLLALGEVGIGVLLLIGGRAALIGYAAAIVFHLALMLFGWGAWLWSLPALALLTWLMRREAAAVASQPAVQRAPA